MKTNVLLIILLFSSFLAYSDSSSKDRVRYEAMTLPNTQVRHIHSKITGIDYKIYINIPSSYYASPKSQTYPSLYLLDADYSFPLAKQMSEHLSDRGRIPEIFLIGIAYDGPNQYRLHRTRDYTISHTSTGGYSEEIQKSSGGAEKFMGFIKQELIPYIESSFPVNASRGIVGHSLGGLFASYVLVNDPELFQNHIIISASLWYDNETLLKAAKEKQNFNQNQAHKLYMVIGGEENGGLYRMIDEQRQFLEIINGKPHYNLSVTSQIFPHFDHDMIVPAALSRGLMILYS